MTFKRILLIGDSFCAMRDKTTDWPIILGKLLGRKVKGEGYGGNAWWTNYRTLEEFSDKKHDTVLVVIHTESSRLPNDFNIPINYGVLHSIVGSPNSEIKSPYIQNLAKNFYKSELFSLDFYDWAQAAWIKELDNNLDFYATIHIPAFDSVDLSQIKNGIVLRPSKEIRSLRELSGMEITEKKWFGPDIRRNHFSNHNNLKMAEAVASTIRQLGTHPGPHQYFDNLDQWDFTKVSFTTLKI